MYSTSIWNTLVSLIVNRRCVKRDNLAFTITRNAKAASGRLSFNRGYNQTCHWFRNLRAAIPKLHAKFHQNRWSRFGEKRKQDTDIV